MERLNAKARPDALASSRRIRLLMTFRAVSGFQASEMESESEQRRIFLGRAQELAGVEQRIVEQAAVVSQDQRRVCSYLSTAACSESRIFTGTWSIEE